ncbi:MAG: hypothetical protein ACHQT6_06795 [Candidatus Acidiferrales bacterium]
MKKLVLLAVVLLLSATCTWAQLKIPADEGHQKCTLQTMTGTYAFSERGSSSYADMTGTAMSPPAPPPFWNALDAPFATVGEVTFAPNGVGEGFYWIWTGLVPATLDPIPVTVTITEMNPDCTGKFSYTVPGTPPVNIVERFIAIDEGREFRSVPATIENGVPGLAWIGEGHRIRKADEGARSCGAQTAHGTYVTTAINVVNFFGTTGFADALIMYTKNSKTGQFTGTLYEKLGVFPEPIEDPIYGNVTVHPDCSFEETLYIPAISGIVPIRGVFYNEGKEFYAMAVNDPANPGGIIYSIGEGKRIDE